MGPNILGSNLGSIASARRQFRQNQISLDVNTSPKVPNLNVLGQDRKVNRYDYRERVREYTRHCLKSNVLLDYLDEEWINPEPGVFFKTCLNIVIADCLEHGHFKIEELDCSPTLRSDRELIKTLNSIHDNVISRLVVAYDLPPSILNLLGTAYNLNPMAFVTALEHVGRDGAGKSTTFSTAHTDPLLGWGAFSYESETTITATIVFSPHESKEQTLKKKLSSPRILQKIDQIIREFDRGDRFSQRPIQVDCELFSPPVKVTESGDVVVERSYRVLNRLTCLRIPHKPCDIYLVLTTPSNLWVQHGYYTAESKSTPGVSHNLISTFSNRIYDDDIADIVRVDIDDTGNPFFSKCYNNQALGSLWEHQGMSQVDTSGVSTTASYFVSDLLEASAPYISNGYQMFLALNLKSSAHALEASKNAAQEAKRRLTFFETNFSMSREESTTSSIEELRKHRDSLIISKERIEANIAQFERYVSRLREENAKVDRILWQEAKIHQTNFEMIRSSYQATIEWNEQLMRDYHLDLQMRLTHSQLEESRRSIEQNATVKRLTGLAFIFVPVSTISTVFGMNLAGFDAISPWIFAVSLILVVGAVIVATSYMQMKAIASALEAVAFEFIARSEKDQIFSMPKDLVSLLEKLVEVVLYSFSYVCIAFLAMISLVIMLLQMIVHVTRSVIRYGLRQEAIYANRRVDITNSEVRNMVAVNLQSWYAELERSRWWWSPLIGRIIWLPGFLFAFFVHRLSPQSEHDPETANNRDL